MCVRPRLFTHLYTTCRRRCLIQPRASRYRAAPPSVHGLLPPSWPATPVTENRGVLMLQDDAAGVNWRRNRAVLCGGAYVRSVQLKVRCARFLRQQWTKWPENGRESEFPRLRCAGRHISDLRPVTTSDKAAFAANAADSAAQLSDTEKITPRPTQRRVSARLWQCGWQRQNQANVDRGLAADWTGNEPGVLGASPRSRPQLRCGR